MLLRTFSTSYQTPSGALGVELSGNINEKTQIQSIRAIFLIIAIVVPVVIMGVFEKKYGLTNPVTYLNMAYLNGCFCIVTGLIAIIGTYSYIPRLRMKDKPGKIKEKFSLKKVAVNFVAALKEKNIKSIVFGYTSSMMSIVFLSSLMIHVLKFTFHIKDIFVLMGAVFVMTILSQPLWIVVSKKKDKKTALYAGLITAVSGTFLLLFAVFIRDFLIKSGIAFYVLFPILSIMGAGAGAMYSMPLSMLGDAIEYLRKREGDEKTGAYTGYTTLAIKLSQSVTLFFIGVLMDLIGFREGSPDLQPYGVEWGIGLMLGIGIMLSLSGGLVFYRQYNIKKEDLVDN
jgi:Na+/melibiose symporter-like transporter